jgi:hypothetical protein
MFVIVDLTNSVLYTVSWYVYVHVFRYHHQTENEINFSRGRHLVVLDSTKTLFQ